jgi:hypothetical protein
VGVSSVIVGHEAAATLVLLRALRARTSHDSALSLLVSVPVCCMTCIEYHQTPWKVTLRVTICSPGKTRSHLIGLLILIKQQKRESSMDTKSSRMFHRVVIDLINGESRWNFGYSPSPSLTYDSQVSGEKRYTRVIKTDLLARSEFGIRGSLLAEKAVRSTDVHYRFPVSISISSDRRINENIQDEGMVCAYNSVLYDCTLIARLSRYAYESTSTGQLFNVTRANNVSAVLIILDVFGDNSRDSTKRSSDYSYVGR